MVGTAPQGELTAATTGSPRKVRFVLAKPEHDAAIRRLLRENPMPGAISLTLEREPNYFFGAGLAQADDRTILAFEGERLICMGRCTTRDAWLNGQLTRIAYLGELRLDRAAQGRFDVLRGGYRFFQSLRGTAATPYTFTSVAADNQRARQLLERGARGLPRYEFLSELSTLVISTHGLQSGGTRLERASMEDIASFLNVAAVRRHLATAWTPEVIAALADHGLPLERLVVQRHKGRIVAAAALWDQHSFRQTVIRGYSRPLALARPLLRLLTPLTRLPVLPRPPSVLAHAFLSPLAFAPGHEALLPEFVAACAREAAGLGLAFVTFALPSADPGVAGVRKGFRLRTYASRLYRVTWPDDPPVALDPRPILPDVSLL